MGFPALTFELVFTLFMEIFSVSVGVLSSIAIVTFVVVKRFRIIVRPIRFGILLLFGIYALLCVLYSVVGLSDIQLLILAFGLLVVPFLFSLFIYILFLYFEQKRFIYLVFVALVLYSLYPKNYEYVEVVPDTRVNSFNNMLILPSPRGYDQYCIGLSGLGYCLGYSYSVPRRGFL